MRFNELSEKRQEKIMSLLTAYYLLKGVDSSKKIKMLKIKDKSSKWWHNQHWWYMKGIDSHRERMGLSRIYS